MNKLKLITSVLGFLLFIYNGKAQESENETSESNLTYGFKIGAAFSAFTHHNEPFTDKKAGIVTGGFVGYQFYDFLGVSVEPAYIQKGALNLSPDFLYDDPNIYSPYTITQISKVTSHHVQVPVLINLQLPDKTSCPGIFLSLGAAVAYTLNVTACNLMDYGTLNGQKYYETSKEGVTTQFEEWQYQLIIGPGIEFKNSIGNILLNVQYQIGINEINKYNYQNQLYEFSSNSWIFSLGFRLK